jgi:hypothetical protein
LRLETESAKIVLQAKKRRMSAVVVHQLRAELQHRFEVQPGIRRKTEHTVLSTGIAAIDRLIGGGIPRGNLTELCGPDSSGRTALAISILCEATRQGECCAWIDASGSFDPASACDTGVILDRLLWINCAGHTENAMKSCDLLIQAGGFGLVVLDLADTPEAEARRISLASWFRLRHAAERTGTALITVERCINARSCSAVQLEMRRKRTVTRGKLLAGLALEAASRKHFQVQTADFCAVR